MIVFTKELIGDIDIEPLRHNIKRIDNERAQVKDSLDTGCAIALLIWNKSLRDRNITSINN